MHFHYQKRKRIPESLKQNLAKKTFKHGTYVLKTRLSTQGKLKSQFFITFIGKGGGRPQFMSRKTHTLHAAGEGELSIAPELSHARRYVGVHEEGGRAITEEEAKEYSRGAGGYAANAALDEARARSRPVCLHSWIIGHLQAQQIFFVNARV